MLPDDPQQPLQRKAALSGWLPYCCDAFDALYRESARTPRMLSVGLHSKIIGRPGRIGALDHFLAHVRQFPGVWLAPRTDIARFWAERFAPPGTWNWPS